MHKLATWVCIQSIILHMDCIWTVWERIGSPISGQWKLKDLFLATSSKPTISLPWKKDAGTSTIEGKCYLATVSNDCLSHEVTGIDQDINTDMTSCKEVIGALDENSNLHWNCINRDMNTLNSYIQECDCRSSRNKKPTVRSVDFLCMRD